MRRDIFQAIVDPTRRAIIALIALQAMTPNAIAERFDITRQAVSKHLRILTECELIKQEHKGREIYYQLDKLRKPVGNFETIKINKTIKIKTSCLFALVVIILKNRKNEWQFII